MSRAARMTERDALKFLLACVGSDASMPTDPDEVAAELGPMKPSQAIAVANFAKRLQAFFTEDELRKLGEIQ